MDERRFVVRCRAIILHEGKLLAVRHVGGSFLALPGGHLEWGEGLVACIEREIVEELGVTPVIGRLLYTQTFVETPSKQPVEFFFEVTNGAEYLGCEQRERTHAYEIAEVSWIAPTDDFLLLPEQIALDFRAGTLLSDRVRHISAM